MPDEMCLNVRLLSFRNDSLLQPSDRLPSLEFDLDLIGTDRLHQVKKDMTVDGVACEVERFVDLDETAGHWILG